MFRGRHFDRSIILLCVRWYLAYGLSLRELEEMMAERGISVDHATIHRWVIRYSPKLLRRFDLRKRALTSARTILGGIEMIAMMRKRQARYAFNPRPSLAEQFDILAA